MASHIKFTGLLEYCEEETGKDFDTMLADLFSNYKAARKAAKEGCEIGSVDAEGIEKIILVFLAHLPTRELEPRMPVFHQIIDLMDNPPPELKRGLN